MELPVRFVLHSEYTDSHFRYGTIFSANNGEIILIENGVGASREPVKVELIRQVWLEKVIEMEGAEWALRCRAVAAGFPLPQ